MKNTHRCFYASTTLTGDEPIVADLKPVGSAFKPNAATGGEAHKVEEKKNVKRSELERVFRRIDRNGHGILTVRDLILDLRHCLMNWGAPRSLDGTV